MIITQTPLRVSFLGGNTDLPSYYLNYGGLVLTTTIDKYIYCIVKERFDDLIKVGYSINEEVNDVNDLKHDLVREALKMLGIKKGIEIKFLSDIPTVGSGLGSSSAVTVGVLNALHQYLGDSVGATQLAEEAVKIEIGILKKPIGIQDQYAVALGGLRVLHFYSDNSVESERIELHNVLREDLDNSLMLFYTGITRKSDDILATLDVGKNLELLNKNKELASEGIKAIREDRFKDFGELLNVYWETKKKLSDKISNKEIDVMYERAKDAGAIGGKIIGAGGGGFMLLMVPEANRGMVRAQLADFKELPFRLEKDGSKVVFNIRRY